MVYQLKNFPFTYLDLKFFAKQIGFTPLYDTNGKPIINWNGTGAIYDANGNVVWDGSGLTAADAIAQFGISYPTYTSSIGLRDISGYNNNLFNQTWGSSDQPFLQRTKVVFDNYVKPLEASDPNAFYALKFGGTTSPASADYTKIGDDLATPGINEAHSAANVVDYTPRMISSTVTTAGVTFQTEPGSTHLIKNANGYTAVADYGVLGALGQQDTQPAINGDIGTGGFVADTNPDTNTNKEWFIGSTNPGVAPVNGWFVLFGQFFDHGLDFIGKGADGTKITINLAPDDPMYGVIDPNTGRPATKIVISRADVSGFTADGTPQWVNHTSPYIDQSQTYGSHEQLTTLLRAWTLDPVSNVYRPGAEMFDGQTSVAWKDASGNLTHATLPTLNELRAHLIETGRDDLTWEDVANLRNRDPAGDVIADGQTGAGGSGAALLLDMNPRFDKLHFENPLNPDAGAEFQANIDTLSLAAQELGFTFGYNGATIELSTPAGAMGPGSSAMTFTGASALYLWVNFADFSIKTTMSAGPTILAVSPAVHEAVGELLLASVGDHYIAGDGRANENIGLTAVHHVFHEEHNFQVENIKQSITALDTREAVLDATNTYNHTLLHEWQINTGVTDVAGNYVDAGGNIAWNEDMLFNAAKMTVEMEYQHTAVDQFARTITPNLHEFVGYNSGENATISLDFSQVAYRFGHSTLRESIDLMDPNGSITDHVMRVALERAFLSPEKFAAVGAGALALGMTHQQANEIDEFLTPALNQGLLGQPLDLAAINIARGRDLGIPTLNDMREALQLTRYTSWSDFGANMLHPDNLVNFIAAYSFDGNIARAEAILGLADDTILEGSDEAMGYTTQQAIDFLNNSDATLYGVDAFNKIDCWLGGLAEVHVTGGLLGETFDTIFVDQIGRVMDGDRFYYLQRLSNIPYGQQIIDEQFKDIIERTTGAEHLNGSAFAYADQYYDFAGQEVASAKTEHKYGDALAANPTLGIVSDGGTTTGLNGAVVTIGGQQYIRDFRVASLATKTGDPSGFALDGAANSGAESHEVIVGTDNSDLFYMRGGDDTAYGEAGQDIIYGGNGIDRLYGGAGEDKIFGGDGGDLIDGGDGDDILYGEQSATAAAGVDQVIGSRGNDYVDGGIGIDKLSGSEGDDVIFGGGDTDAFTHAGEGNDYIDGGITGDLLWGDNGDDLIAGQADQDIVAGMQGDDILRPGPVSQSLTNGGDEVIGGDGVSDAGNDGKGIGFDLLDLSDWQAAPVGATFDLVNQANPLPAIDGAPQFPAVAQIEGVIGTRNNDTFTGDANDNWLIGGSGNDTLSGGLGDDLIIGDGVRLDDIIGTYASNYDLYFDGASHRAFGYANEAETTGLQRNFIQSNGLLDAVGWGNDKHFTEMLKTAMFRNLELGGSQVTQLWRNGAAQTTGESAGTMGDGGTAGSQDTVVFVGNFEDYQIEEFQFTTAQLTTLTALKITDLVAGRGGADVVVGTELFKFNDGIRTLAQVLNAPPVINSNGAGAAADVIVDENTTLVTTVSATDAEGQAITYSLAGGADAALFNIDSISGALSFNNAPNFEAPTNAGANNVYDVIVQASDGSSTDKQVLAVSVQNTDEASTGALHITYLRPGNNSVTLSPVNTISDPDAPAAAFSYHWQVGTRNTNNAGAPITWGAVTTAPTFTATNQIVRLFADYTDGPFGTKTVQASEVTLVTANNGNNQLFGTTGADILLGLGGNDTLTADAGNDTVDGGTGNDVLRATINDGNDLYIGGAGSDRYDLSLTSVAATVDLATGTATSAQTGTDTLQEIERAVGGSGNDTITGSAAANVLEGGAGDDLINAEAGADTINGGNGSDTIVMGADNARDTVNGGQGFDTVDYFAFTTAIRVTLNGGSTVTVNGSGTGNNTDQISSIENVIGGSANDTLTGDINANILSGGGGADFLTGGGARDYLLGGLGSDTFDFNNVNDVVLINNGAVSGANGTNVSQLELIADFITGQDHIDLRSIDARTGLFDFGDQNFNWRGTSAFTSGTNGTANGGVHYAQLQDNTGQWYTIVEASNDSDIAAEFQLALLGRHTLSAGDFIL